MNSFWILVAVVYVLVGVGVGCLIKGNAGGLSTSQSVGIAILWPPILAVMLAVLILGIAGC